MARPNVAPSQVLARTHQIPLGKERISPAIYYSPARVVRFGLP